MVRGPGVPKNVTLDDIVLNIDLAPTIVGLATGAIPSDMDGSNFMSLFLSQTASSRSTSSWRSDFLVGYNGKDMPVAPPPGKIKSRGPEAKHQQPIIGHRQDSRNNTYSCLRTIRSATNSQESSVPISTVDGSATDPTSTPVNTMYCQFQDDESFVEFYDLSTDPWQLDNRANELTAEDHLVFAKRLDEFKACSGESCRSATSSNEQTKLNIFS